MLHIRKEKRYDVGRVLPTKWLGIESLSKNKKK